MKSTYKAFLPMVAAVLALGAVSAAAQTTLPVKEDRAQLASDKSALQRQITRLEADEARLEFDTNSGRMSAESKDSYEVYRARHAVKAEEKQIAADKTAAFQMKAAKLQMKADKAALHRQVRRLELAEARLKADTREGKMAAESKDSTRVYQDGRIIKGEKKDIAADNAKLKTDQTK